jgi:competence ComEA-like helix-hairpin-helix protein
VERPSRRQPQPAPFTRTEKFPAGTLVELNTADTTTLKKVPGIGSAFAGRIVKYRVLLGGFYSVEQLREVYGIDEERYLALQNWFYADTSFIAKLPVNLLPSDSLAKHPYITYRQARVLWQQRRRDGRLNSWENLRLLEEFTETDRERLSAYLSFQ